MNIPLRKWSRGDHITAADLNRMTEAIKRATPVAGKGISVSQSLGGSVITFTGRGAGGAGGGAAEENFPFQIKRVNSNTAQSPVWHTLVYIPDYAITTRFGITSSGMSQYDSTNYPNWYEFTNDIGGLGPVCLHVRVVNAGTTACYWRLGGLAQDTGWPGGEGVAILRTYVIPLGVVSGSGAGEIAQLVSSAIYVAADFVGSGGGGGGTPVIVDDERTDTSNVGIVGYGGTSQEGISFIVRDGIGPDLVFFMASDTTIGTLVDYLAGRLDFEDDATFGGLGKNVNTENFASECLGPAETPDVPGDGEDPSGLAAPSAHTHTIGQIVAEEGSTLSDDLITFFSNAGLFAEMGETGPSGGDYDYSILTVGDIDLDDSWYKPDAATGYAGDINNDGLALSGHRHPLNVADTIMATGPTGDVQPPPAGDYVKAVGVGTGPSGEASPTTAGFGSQPFYARVDHIHPICAEMGPTGTVAATVGPTGGEDFTMSVTGDFGPTGAPAGVTLDQNGWTPGEQGYTESYCCRMVKGSDGFTTYAIFRQRKVSRTGIVLWVGPEYVGFSLAR